MPVVIACSCGKKLKVPDNLVGKRVKCPVCGGPIDVKAGGSQATEDKLKVTCACGATLSAPKRLLGTDVKCPKCGQFVTVENETGHEETAAPPPAAPAEQPSSAAPQTVDPGEEGDGYAIQQPKCKRCGEDMSFGDVVCLSCGTNQNTGEAVAEFDGEVEKEQTAGPGAPPKALIVGIVVVVLIAAAAAAYFKFFKDGGANAPPQSRRGAAQDREPVADSPETVEEDDGRAPVADAPEPWDETDVVEQEKTFGDDSEWALERYVYAPRRAGDKVLLLNANRAVDMFRQAEGRPPESLEEVEQRGYGPIQRPSEEDLDLAIHPATEEVVMIRRR